MKKILILIMLWLICLPVFGASALENFDAFCDRARQLTNVTSTELIADTVVYRLCSDAIVYTSADIGGLETQYKINTVADQAFYSIADSIVSINRVTVLTADGETKSLRLWYPQYFDYWDMPTMAQGDEADVPIAYDFWADTLQVMPIPQRVDSIYLKAYVEHRTLSTDDDSDDIAIRPAFAKAALDLACSDICMKVGLFEKADKFLARYEIKKKALLERYFREMEIGPPVKQ